MAKISFAELNGVRVTELVLTMPPNGRWTADARLDVDAAAVAKGSPVSLSLGGLTLAGSVARAGNLYGEGQLRLVAGAGGWGREIRPEFYKSPAGLRLRPLLADAAKLAGETVVVPDALNRIVGFFYARPRAPASRVLRLATPGWWVRPDGATEVGERLDTMVTSNFDVFPQSDLGCGRVLISTDRPEDWSPGCRFATSALSGVRQASVVVHHLTPKTFRTEVWTSP